jgi:hypothetical protein
VFNGAAGLVNATARDAPQLLPTDVVYDVHRNCSLSGRDTLSEPKPLKFIRAPFAAKIYALPVLPQAAHQLTQSQSSIVKAKDTKNYRQRKGYRRVEPSTAAKPFLTSL